MAAKPCCRDIGFGNNERTGSANARNVRVILLSIDIWEHRRSKRSDQALRIEEIFNGNRYAV